MFDPRDHEGEARMNTEGKWIRIILCLEMIMVLLAGTAFGGEKIRQFLPNRY